MSGAFPTGTLPSSVSIRSITPTLEDIAQSGRRNVRVLGVQKWALSAHFPSTLSKDQYMPILGFLLEQQGRFETFTFVSPDLATPRGAAAGTPLVDLGSQVGTTLNTKGWTASTTFKIGDVFTLAGHNKVYMLTQNATADGSGDMTLTFQPPLMESPANNEALTKTNVAFTVQLKSDTTEYSVSGPFLYNFAMELIEVV
jgi:hypothetical protein